MSRLHSELCVDGPNVTISYKDSSTGTFLNDARLGFDERRPLRSGDLIRIGDTQLRYESDEDLAGEATVIGGVPLAQAVTLAGLPSAAVPRGGSGAVAPTSVLAELVGTTLGHYTITRFLTEGQTSVLFRALDTVDDRAVTLKVLKERGKSEAEMQRLARTLKPVLTLHHPHLMTLHDLGRDREKTWFALEWVEGDSVAQIIKRAGLADLVD